MKIKNKINEEKIDKTQKQSAIAYLVPNGNPEFLVLGVKNLAYINAWRRATTTVTVV